MNVRSLLLLASLAAACSDASSRTTTNALGAATIGPEGGVIEVAGGDQAGLRLTIPPGAVTEPTLFAVQDASLVAEDDTRAVSLAPVANPILLEPRELRLAEMATLRLPYAIANVADTAPGNVRARQRRNGNTIDHEPAAIDVRDGWMEVPVRTLSQFQVVRGPVTSDVSAYWQPVATQVALSEGRSFAVEAVPATSPFASPEAVRWRLQDPDAEVLLYFDGRDLLARESVTDNWRETWDARYPVWTNGQGQPVGAATITAQVSRPIGTLPVAGRVTVFGAWSWGEPRTIAGRRLLDVARLRITLAWDRADLGVGSLEYVFWFAPGVGLLAWAKDGVTWERLTI